MRNPERKECATLSGFLRASLRYPSVPYMTRDGAIHPERYRHKTAWYSIRPTHDFQAVKFGGSKGGLGRAQRAGAEAGCRTLEDGSGKEGEPKASGAERADNIDHTAITVIRKRDVQDRWWILDSL